MKKVISLIISFFLFSALHAQISKGTWLFGGTGSYSSETLTNTLGDNPNYKTTQIQGNAGYFIVNKLAVGLRPDIFFSTAELRFNDIKSKIFSIGPFARYYFLSDDQMVNLFLDGGYSFGRSEVTGQNSYGTNQFAIMGGPAIFLNSSVALELSVGYTQINSDDGINSQKKSLRVGIGFQFHLQKK